MRLKALDRIAVNAGEIIPGQRFNADDSYGLSLVRCGRAERMPEPDESAWRAAKGQWDDETVVCIASGPSLDPADCDLVRVWRDRGKGKVIVVNSSIERAPWADVLYAGDRSWWREHGHDKTTATRWSMAEEPHIEGKAKFAPKLIGPSTGHQAVSLAEYFGASRIILLAYDMMDDKGKQQWHDPHPNAPQFQPYQEWIVAFDQMATDLSERGIKVVNCSRRTALKCFPRASLQDELASALSAA